MAKKFRLIPSVLYKSGSVVKSVQFEDHRVVGDLPSTMRVFSRRQADELVIFDLDAANSNEIDWGMVEACVENCNMPLCYGGGIDRPELAIELISRGFDKVACNTALFETPDCVSGIAAALGSSSTVGSVDIKEHDGALQIFSASGTKCQGPLEPKSFCRFVENIGVGELIINRIDLDGTMQGYKFDLMAELIEEAPMPVLISGGCSGDPCIAEAYKMGFDGALMSSIFLWKGDSIPSLKNQLRDCVPIREVI